MLLTLQNIEGLHCFSLIDVFIYSIFISVHGYLFADLCYYNMLLSFEMFTPFVLFFAVHLCFTIQNVCFVDYFKLSV